MSDSTSKSLTDLVRALASATGWVQHVVDLNTALQPFLARGLNLDAIEQSIADANDRLTGIGIQIRAAEDQLESTNSRITLADDARQHVRRAARRQRRVLARDRRRDRVGYLSRSGGGQLPSATCGAAATSDRNGERDSRVVSEVSNDRAGTEGIAATAVPNTMPASTSVG